MAQPVSNVSVYKGRYHRTIGKVLGDQGQLVPKKFLLGTDRVAAEIANGLLEQLWAEVVAEYADAERFIRTMGEQLLDANLIMGEIDYTRKRRLPPCPVWRADSLIIAEAIRRGERQVMVRAGAKDESPEGYLERIAGLRRTYSVIAFVPAHAEVYAAGQQAMVSQAASMVQDATQLAATAQTSLPTVTGQTLHQAMDAYAQYAAKRDSRESSLREAAAAKRLKPSHPDIALSQFGISCLERMAVPEQGTENPSTCSTTPPVNPAEGRRFACRILLSSRRK